MEEFCKEVRAGLSQGDAHHAEPDHADWLSHPGFAVSCRKKWSSLYATVRNRANWSHVVAVVDLYAENLFGRLDKAFLRNTAPAECSNEGEGVKGLLGHDNISQILGIEPFGSRDEDEVVKFLGLRRAILAAAKKYQILIAGDREALEALLAAFLNFAPPPERDSGFVTEKKYKKYGFSLRPFLTTNAGLKPSELCQGPDSVPNLGQYEKVWLARIKIDGSQKPPWMEHD